MSGFQIEKNYAYHLFIPSMFISAIAAAASGDFFEVADVRAQGTTL